MRMRSALPIAQDHPVFAGHFPTFPVVPGAMLLDEALRAIAGTRHLDLTEWQLAAAKFLATVRPRDALWLEHEDSDGLIRFSLLVEEYKVATGTLSNIERRTT